jgi:beta-lactamase regulating signal transducer with metallopeptidase domain
MASDALVLLARLNLVVSAAIMLVLLLRPLVRQRLGAHQAYLLWLLAPVALVGAMLPAMFGAGPAGVLEQALSGTRAWLAVGSRGWIVTDLWGIGVICAAVAVAWRYAWFLAQARSGRAGPAVVGVITPRLVVPSDFADRFTPDERRLVRAHERAHMDRLDSRCNAIVLALQCLNWFNPLVHIAASALRFDQELACDATVMTRLPTARRQYAETLLRSQLGAAVSPLGCGWSRPGVHQLAIRLATLMQRHPSSRRSDLGDVLISVLWAVIIASAWSAQPPDRGPWAVYIVLLS